jgi:uncharacterized protein YjbI with pentapeptide repeats
MKPLTILAATWTLAAAIGAAVVSVTPADAQNAGQIDRSRDGASCPHCNLFQADFSNLDMKGRDFTGSRLRQADFSAAIMNRTSFAGADLRDVNAYGAVLTGVNFAGANMTNATFVGAYLEGANFAGANLTGVNLSGAEMDHASGLTEAQLEAACGDETTLLPHGMHVHACS